MSNEFQEIADRLLIMSDELIAIRTQVLALEKQQRELSGQNIDEFPIQQPETMDTNPVEEAKRYGRLRDQGMTIKQIAENVGRKSCLVYERLKLYDMDFEPEILDLIASGRLPKSYSALYKLWRFNDYFTEIGRVQVAKEFAKQRSIKNIDNFIWMRYGDQLRAAYDARQKSLTD